MSVPLPETPLGSHCSAIRSNTLYTFSEDAFQSLELTKGAKWQKLPSGIGTAGAACVLAHQGTVEESLYVVGGSTSDLKHTPESGYSGLQRYIFAQKAWKPVEMAQPSVMFNLTNHGATFVESTQQLFVVGGGSYPNNNVPSAMTFLIKTLVAVPETLSLAAEIPFLAPIVLPWGNDGALVIGGGAQNINLNTWTTSGGFQQLDTVLDKGLPARGSGWASLVDRDDGSRGLVTFDMTVSPTTVTEYTVKGAGNSKRQTAPSASPAGSNGPSTTSNWPKYNSKGAPTGKRTGTSMSSDGDVVVISGGDDIEPLLVFNTRKNTWVDAQQVVGTKKTSKDNKNDKNDKNDKSDKNNKNDKNDKNDKNNKNGKNGKNGKDGDKVGTESVSTGADPSGSGSTPIVIPSQGSSTSPTSSPSSSLAAAHGNTHRLNNVQLLFVVLGSLLGAGIILGCIFIFLRRRHQEGRCNHGTGKGRMSFQDRGASFMKEAGESVPLTPPQFSNHPNDSWSQLQHQATFPNPTPAPLILPISSPPILPYTAPPIQKNRPADKAVKADKDKERGSGWSKYFSGSSANNLAPASSEYTNASYRRSGLHPNPNLYNAGPGVAAGGERRGSDYSMESIAADSYSSEIPETLLEHQQAGWNPVDGGGSVYAAVGQVSGLDVRANPRRGDVPSSVYTDTNRYSGPPPSSRHEGVDNMSWLNLRAA
jgi:hypothetical protein